MIQYEPWADSHAPKNFHRTDPTGRWSPIVEDGRSYGNYAPIPEPKWLAVAGGVLAGIVGAFVLYLWCTV